MSRFEFGTDEIGVILVHGFVRRDMDREITELIGEHHVYEIYCDGGYTLSLVTTRLVHYDCGEDDILEIIYDAEEFIPDVRPDKSYPVFYGILDEPFDMTTDENMDFRFVGGMWGYDYDDDGSGYRYQE